MFQLTVRSLLLFTNCFVMSVVPMKDFYLFLGDHPIPHVLSVRDKHYKSMIFTNIFLMFSPFCFAFILPRSQSSHLH